MHQKTEFAKEHGLARSTYWVLETDWNQLDRLFKDIEDYALVRHGENDYTLVGRDELAIAGMGIG